MPRRGRHDIVFYSPLAGPIVARESRPTGGAEMQIVHLARGLAARGLSVAIVTYATPGLPELVDGVRMVPHGRPEVRFGSARRLMVLLTMAATLLRLDTRVVVQRSAGPTTGIVALIARARRLRFVYSSASTTDFAYEQLETRRVLRGLYELGVRLADPIVVQTDEQVALCRARFGREPSVVRSVAERAPARTAEPEAFLWIGRLAAYKNPMAYVDLARSVPEARFVMVCVRSEGDSPADAERLARAAAELPNLELVGQQDRPALLALVDRAVAVVSTSDFEGMSNTLLEGWSRGVPALTLRHDPDGLIVREGLGGCADGSAAQLAALARSLWAARAPGGAVSDRCRAYVAREHDVERVVGRWITLLGLSSRAGTWCPRPSEGRLQN